ncbi:MAG: glycosyltransferase family 4 protein [archaeon]|nr:MAG: glycosyltransferase family 4 protein [archaeon]
MRVLMVGWEFPPYVSGGLGTHTYELTRKMPHDVNITFFMPDRGEVSVPWMDIKRIKTSIGFGPYMTFGGSVLKESIIKSVEDYAKEVGKTAKQTDFDIVHCHDWLTVMGGICAKRENGKPLVFTVHSTEYDRSIGNPCPWVMDIERYGINEADGIIAVSKRIKEQIIEKYGADPGKIRVVYNAIDSSSFDCGLKFKPTEDLILSLGRLTLHKGIDHLLRAAKIVIEHHPSAKFVIAGKGDKFKDLVEMSIDLGIEKNVFFLGYVPQEDITKLYARADVFLMPSVFEPFGITALEAMAAGTPTIISKTSGVCEVTNNVFKIDFWDTEKMASRILEILNYKELFEEMSNNCRSEAKRITWDDIAMQTKDFYESVLR